MPLPQKVIEQLGREPPKTPGWSGQLLMFSSTMFFASLLLYLGLAFGYQPYLTGQVRKVQDQIQAFSQEVSVDQQTKLINFYSQLSNLRTLLANHLITSPVFAWLEKNTQVNIYFSKFVLSQEKNQLTLGGVAKNMDDINQQFAIFQADPDIDRMNIGSASLNNGAWQFEVVLFFRKGYFSSSASNTVAK